MRRSKTRTGVFFFFLAFLLGITACSSSTDEESFKPVRIELAQQSAIENSLSAGGWKVKNADQESVHLFDTDASYNILLAENQDSNLLYIAFFTEEKQAKEAYDSLCSQRSETISTDQGDYEQAIIPLEDQGGSWIFRLYDKDIVGCWFVGDEAKEKEVENFLSSLQKNAPASTNQSDQTNEQNTDQAVQTPAEAGQSDQNTEQADQENPEQNVDENTEQPYSDEENLQEEEVLDDEVSLDELEE